MYLFQRYRYSSCQAFVCLFTFHYVSISTWTDCCRYSASSRIYIPLCIYFNWTLSDFVNWVKKFTFHYVSISTDSGHSGGGGSSRFTFHYVSISTESYLNRHTRENIYIPLCIYFNLRFLNLVIRVYQFTFHYVSISTPKMSGGCGDGVQIYIPLCIYFNIVCPHPPP